VLSHLEHALKQVAEQDGISLRQSGVRISLFGHTSALTAASLNFRMENDEYPNPNDQPRMLSGQMTPSPNDRSKPV
jgi:hypothetical protein